MSKALGYAGIDPTVEYDTCAYCGASTHPEDMDGENCENCAELKFGRQSGISEFEGRPPRR